MPKNEENFYEVYRQLLPSLCCYPGLWQQGKGVEWENHPWTLCSKWHWWGSHPECEIHLVVPWEACTHSQRQDPVSHFVLKGYLSQHWPWALFCWLEHGVNNARVCGFHPCRVHSLESWTRWSLWDQKVLWFSEKNPKRTSWSFKVHWVRVAAARGGCDPVTSSLVQALIPVWLHRLIWEPTPINQPKVSAALCSPHPSSTGAEHSWGSRASWAPLSGGAHLAELKAGMGLQAEKLCCHLREPRTVTGAELISMGLLSDVQGFKWKIRLLLYAIVKFSPMFHKQTFASWTPFNISSDTHVEQSGYICFLCTVSKHGCLNS